MLNIIRAIIILVVRMKLIKVDTEWDINILLEDSDKTLSFDFLGNGDLYWIFRSNESTDNHEFIITKENYQLYRLFLELFSDIKNINIFETYDLIIQERAEEIEELELRREYLKEKELERPKILDSYRLYNLSYYNELYNKDENKITWYSDETSNKVSNYLEIVQEDEIFKINFYTQEDIKGYDKDFKSDRYIPIRFRNSGSRYRPFNTLFMKMYNNMKLIDDVNDINHQISIDEYVYTKKFNKD